MIFAGTPDGKAADQAGWVQRWLVERFLCTDPAANGHENVRGRLDADAPATPAEAAGQDAADAAEQDKAAKSAARSKMLKLNREWRAYTELRVAHLTGLCGKRKLTAPVRSAATVLTALAGARVRSSRRRWARATGWPPGSSAWTAGTATTGGRPAGS